MKRFMVIVGGALLALSAILLSFSSLLAPYALRAWPAVFTCGLLALGLFGRRAASRLLQQFPYLLALNALLAAAITQVIAANDLPSGLLPLHALPGQGVIYLVIGGAAAFGLTWLSLRREEGAAGAALAAAGLYSSVSFFRVSAVPEVGYAYSVLAGFALLALLSLRDTSLKLSRNEAGYWKWALAFIIALAVSVFLSPVPDQSLNYTLYMVVMIGLSALISAQLKQHGKWGAFAWMTFALGAVLPVGLALIKAVQIVIEFGPDTALAYRLHPSEMGGANLIARSILVAAPLGAALFFMDQPGGRRRGLKRFLLILLQILILAVILYARSFEGFFAWLAAWAVFALLAAWKSIFDYVQRIVKKPVLRWAHIGAGLALLLFILYTGIQVGYRINPYSFSGRFQHWTGAFNAWQHHPLFGGGPDNEYLFARYAGGLTIFGEVQQFIDDPLYVISYRSGLLLVHAHNLLLEIAAFTGLAGLITLIGMIGMLLWIGIRTWLRAGPELRLLIAACLAGIAGELAWGLLDVIRETPPFFSFPVWALVGMLLAAAYITQAESTRMVSIRLKPGNAWWIGFALVTGLFVVLLPAISANRYGSGFLAFQEHRWEAAARNFRAAAMVNPLSAQNYWMLSKAELETGQWTQAEADLRKAVALKRGYSPYLTQAGWLAWLQGDLEAANGYFEEAIASDPLETWTHGLYANLGLLRVYQGREAEAAEYFAKSLEYHPALATAPYWVKSQQPDGTLKVILAPDYDPDQADSGLKTRIFAHLGMANISTPHFSQYLHPEPVLILDEVLDTLHQIYLDAVDRGDPNAHLALAAEAEAARLAGLFERAEAAYLEYQAIRPNSAFGYRDLASVYSAQKQFEKAEFWLEKAAQVSPENIDTLQALSLVQMSRQNTAAAAETLALLMPIASANSFQLRFFDVDLLKTLVQLYRLEQDAVRTRQTLEWIAGILATPEDFIALAQNDQEHQRWDQAAESCWQAYDVLVNRWVRPYNPLLWTAADCISRSAQTDEQIERRAHQSGSDFTASLLLGHIARMRNQPEQAKAFYSLAAQIRSDESAPHYFLGEIHLSLSELDEAERELSTAASLDDHEALPLLSLGRLYEARGDLAAAQEAYQAAAARTPGSADAQMALANIYLRIQNYEAAAPHFAFVQQINAGLQDGTRIDLIANMASAAFSETVAEGFVKGSICTLNGDRATSLFMQPVSWAKFELTLPGLQPGDELWLTFKVGMLPESWGQAGDGVNFAVSVSADGSEQQIYSHYMDPKNNPEERRWEPGAVKLNEFAGQTIALTLMTDGGRAGDTGFDWACWGEPAIIVQEQAPAD